MIASIENMRACRDNGGQQVGYPRVFAYSRTTGEQYSADPGDYWDVPEGFVLKDANSEPMELVVEVTKLVEPKI